MRPHPPPTSPGRTDNDEGENVKAPHPRPHSDLETSGSRDRMLGRSTPVIHHASESQLTRCPPRREDLARLMVDPAKVRVATKMIPDADPGLVTPFVNAIAKATRLESDIEGSVHFFGRPPISRLVSGEEFFPGEGLLAVVVFVATPLPEVSAYLGLHSPIGARAACVGLEVFYLCVHLCRLLPDWLPRSGQRKISERAPSPGKPLQKSMHCHRINPLRDNDHRNSTVA